MALVVFGVYKLFFVEQPLLHSIVTITFGKLLVIFYTVFWERRQIGEKHNRESRVE